MVEELLRIASSLVLIVAVGALLAATRRTHRRHKHAVMLCPGPGSGVWRALLRQLSPRGWFWRSGCRYDLTGQMPVELPDASDALRCPECGRVTNPRRAIRTGYRWRAWRTATVLLLLAVGLAATPFTRGGQWPALLPTMALVTHERLPETSSTKELRDEMVRRVYEGEVQGWTARRLASALVAELREDDVKRNAMRSLNLLHSLGSDAFPALEAGLNSGDYQERQMAAHALRRMRGYTPTLDLIRVTVEGLQDDDIRGRNTWVSNAGSGYYYLKMCPFDEAEPLLAEGIRNGDAQQQWYCARLAGEGGYTALVADAAPLLIEHLRDNDIRGDAASARRALKGFGPPVRPWLIGCIEDEDAQLVKYAKRLLREIPPE